MRDMKWPDEAVFVDEEYGYAHWMWIPEGRQEQTVRQFVAERDVGGMMGGGCLPGRWFKLIPARQVDMSGVCEDYRTYYTSDKKGRLVGQIQLPERYHRAFMHIPEDSGIWFVDGPTVEPIGFDKWFEEMEEEVV